MDNKWCANEEAGPRRRVDCDIPRQLQREKQNIIYKRVKILRESSNRAISASSELGLLQ